VEDVVETIRCNQALAKLVGQAATFKKAIEELPAIAKSDAPALITGETGTGKELVARAIHYLSGRSAFPFIPINCGALSESLLEDELFGHEKGSFTDAHSHRRGVFGQAEKGTLFLDEVDKLSVKGQVDLLRVLQEKRYRTIGSALEQQADVRIISATNANLEELVKRATFRSDLYYRISIFPIQLPPLRDRKEDVMSLTNYFINKHAPPKSQAYELTPTARQALYEYDWPGNVRELENSILRGIYLTKCNKIDVEHLRLATSQKVNNGLQPLQVMKRSVIKDFERNYLLRLMVAHEGNVTHAAITAGKERRDLGRLLKKHAIDPKLFHSKIVAPPADLQNWQPIL
jgi:transcriptional regulator with PAS, ATPase and Fis domain